MGTAADSMDYEGAFPSWYESNDSRGVDAYTVVLDTAVMDEMPAECLPADLADLDAMIVFDTRYTSHSILRMQVYTTVSKGKGNAVLRYVDYITYTAEQRVNVFSGAGKILWRFGSKQTLPDIPEQRTDGFSGSLTDVQIRKACLPVADTAWMEAQETYVLTLLRENNWDLQQAIDAARQQ